MNWKISTMIIGILILSGCTELAVIENNITTIKETFQYNFKDYATNCTLHTNINISDSSYINSVSDSTWIYYGNISGNTSVWNMLTCSFGSSCVWSAETNISKICEDNSQGYVQISSQKLEDKWVFLCCNINGGSCYMDLEGDVATPSTICDINYTTNTIHLDFNNTWNSLCCTAGIRQ